MKLQIVYDSLVTPIKLPGIVQMINFQEIIINHFLAEVKRAYQQTYSRIESEYANILEWTGRLALENIANSDALYHNVEHTILVTLVGQTILRGKHLAEGGITPKDWMHYVMALMCHDIGYVKGVCRADRKGKYATGIGDEVVTLEPGSTDAALTPYHVDRGKLFINERFGSGNLLGDVDHVRIMNYIEMTRYPIPEAHQSESTNGLGGLARAADFIGQLGDPNYLKKIPALYYEFHETGVNSTVGYRSPGHMRDNFNDFYWNVVRPHIEDALRYLQITQAGKHWIANLHSHVFDVEKNILEH